MVTRNENWRRIHLNIINQLFALIIWPVQIVLNFIASIFSAIF